MNDLVVVMAVAGFTLALGTAACLLRANWKLADQLDLAIHDKRLLQIAVSDCRATFRRYALIHHAKNTPEGDKKAMGNDDLADNLEAILKDTGWREEFGPLQKAFAEMRKMGMTGNAR